WLFQGMDMIFEDVIYSILKMGIITGFAFNVGWYMENIVPLVSSIPAGITQILVGSDSNSANMVDTLIGSYMNTVIEFMKGLDFSLFNSDVADLAAAIIALAILVLSGLAFLGVCVSTLIMLKLATTLFLIVGPVFIAFFLFDATKQYAWGWINLLAGFMLTNILFGVVVSVEVTYISNTILPANGPIKADWISLLSMPLVFGAFAVLAQTIPNYAASVMGGTPIGSSSVGSMLRSGGVGAAFKMAKNLSKLRRHRASIE
uniref:type IV secretion system protein n=1 Tax=Pseudomonas huaxiensis TaxID=2213017 RepID=UPI0013004FB3